MMKHSHKSRPRIDESKYAGQWVALDPESFKVVASGDTLKAAETAAMKRGVPDPIYHSVPKSAGYFIGAAS